MSVALVASLVAATGFAATPARPDLPRECVMEASSQKEVLLEMVTRGAPGWQCATESEAIRAMEDRIWLRWLAGRAKTAQQAKHEPTSWKEPIVIEFRTCAPATLPSETLADCDSEPATLYIAKSSGDEEVDRSAMDGVIWSGEWWVFEGCPRNQYGFRATFSPRSAPPEERTLQVLQRLRHTSESIRGLAVDALASMDTGRATVLPCVQWLRRNDPVPEVRAKAQVAIQEMTRARRLSTERR
jgi:hypothetical protein